MFAVRVPATIANLGPGFDTLGMALQLFMEAEVGISTGLNEFIYEGLNAYEIKMVDEDNLFIRAMNRVFEKAGRSCPPCGCILKMIYRSARDWGAAPRLLREDCARLTLCWARGIPPGSFWPGVCRWKAMQIILFPL